MHTEDVRDWTGGNDAQDSDFDFDALFSAYMDARRKGLTLCINRDGGWAQEMADNWIPDQLCRAAGPYDRVEFEAFVRESIEFVNAR